MNTPAWFENRAIGEAWIVVEEDGAEWLGVVRVTTFSGVFPHASVCSLPVRPVGLSVCVCVCVCVCVTLSCCSLTGSCTPVFNHL